MYATKSCVIWKSKSAPNEMQEVSITFGHSIYSRCSLNSLFELLWLKTMSVHPQHHRCVQLFLFPPSPSTPQASFLVHNHSFPTAICIRPAHPPPRPHSLHLAHFLPLYFSFHDKLHSTIIYSSGNCWTISSNCGSTPGFQEFGVI